MTKQSFSWINHVSNQQPLFFILGPCVFENEEQALQIAHALKNLSEKLNFKLIFKGSFDKANRTSIKNFRGVPLEKGLAILENIRSQFHVPVMTDVHETNQVDQTGEVVDVLQIPAFLSRQTDLLLAAANTGKPVHVKKPQFEAPESMINVVDKIKSMGNEHTWLCERGYTFGYQNLIVDYRNFPIMKQFGKPVTFDVTHAVQRPGGLGYASGGDANFIADLAAAAITQRIAGLYLMVHPEPEKALCCGPVSVGLSSLQPLLEYFIELDAWVKSHPIPKINAPVDLSLPDKKYTHPQI